jgi:hypothetical protein
MKIELTRELRHHLPGEGHPAIEAFNHFLAAAASLSNVKTGTDLAPLKESFERAKQILLDAGFQYRKIDTDTFTVWPVGTPCFETLGDNYNPDEVVRTESDDYEGPPVKLSDLKVIVDRRKKPEDTCRSLEAGTAENPTHFIMFCASKNVNAEDYCNRHCRLKESSGGKRAWMHPKFSATRWVVIHPKFGYSFHKFMTGGQLRKHCIHLSLGDPDVVSISPVAGGDMVSEGEAARRVQAMHAAGKEASNSTDFVATLTEVVRVVTEARDEWCGYDLVSRDPYITKNGMTPSRTDVLGDTADRRMKLAESNLLASTDGEPGFYVPGKDKDTKAICCVETVVPAFESMVTPGSELDRAGWNVEVAKGLQSAKFELDQADICRLLLWRSFLTLVHKARAHLQDPRSREGRDELTSLLPKIVGAYMSLQTSLSRFLITLGKEFRDYQALKVAEFLHVDPRRELLAQLVEKLLVCLQELFDALCTDAEQVVDLQSYMQAMFKNCPIVIDVDGPPTCANHGCNNKCCPKEDGSGTFYIYCGNGCRPSRRQMPQAQPVGNGAGLDGRGLRGNPPGRLPSEAENYVRANLATAPLEMVERMYQGILDEFKMETAAITEHYVGDVEAISSLKSLLLEITHRVQTFTFAEPPSAPGHGTGLGAAGLGRPPQPSKAGYAESPGFSASGWFYAVAVGHEGPQVYEHADLARDATDGCPGAEWKRFRQYARARHFADNGHAVGTGDETPVSDEEAIHQLRTTGKRIYAVHKGRRPNSRGIYTNVVAARAQITGVPNAKWASFGVFQHAQNFAQTGDGHDNSWRVGFGAYGGNDDDGDDDDDGDEHGGGGGYGRGGSSFGGGGGYGGFGNNGGGNGGGYDGGGNSFPPSGGGGFSGQGPGGGPPAPPFGGSTHQNNSSSRGAGGNAGSQHDDLAAAISQLNGQMAQLTKSQAEGNAAQVAAVQSALQSAGINGTLHMVNGVGGVVDEALIPAEFFRENLHNHFKGDQVSTKIAGGASHITAVNDSLANWHGPPGASFGDAFGKFCNSALVNQTSGGNDSATREQMSNLSSMLGEHAFGAAHGDKLTVAELARNHFPGGKIAKAFYARCCSSMENFQLYCAGFAKFMESMGRRLRPQGDDTSSSRFQYRPVATGLANRHRSQKEIQWRIHCRTLAMFQSCFTHISSLVRVEVSSEAQSLFPSQAGSWHAVQALGKARLFLEELFHIRESLKPQPILALLAMLGYGENLMLKNWSCPHLDSKTLGAPVFNAGLDQLAEQLQGNSDPFAKMAGLEKSMAESAKKQAATDKLVADLKAELAKKKAAENDKFAQIANRQNSFDQAIKKKEDKKKFAKKGEKDKNKKKDGNNNGDDEEDV